MDIALLADHIEALPALAEWYRDAWEPYYGVDGPGDALADLQSRCNKNALPIGFVALEGDQVQGVAALDLDVVTKLAPSVVGLLVAVEYRDQGVAAQLLESAKNLAGRLGYSRVYISTTILGEHLLKKGWHDFGPVRFLNDQRGSVYAYDLSEFT
jgi:GNAT superfamily N-acetyltransferase